MYIIVCTYFSPAYNIAFADWQTVYLLSEKPVALYPKVHRGALVYRIPTTGKRISYKKLKRNLVKQKVIVRVSLLPSIEQINWLRKI